VRKSASYQFSGVSFMSVNPMEIIGGHEIQDNKTHIQAGASG
jgi:hypothetical protein